MTLARTGGTLEDVKGRRASCSIGAGVLALWASGAWAQLLPGPETNKQDALTRTYTERVQMHKAPGGMPAPDAAGAGEQTLSESLGLSSKPESIMVTPPPPAPPFGPRLRTVPDKTQRNRNWILPPSPDGTPAEPPPKATGWGWLADDVKESQNKADAQAAEQQAEEEEQDKRTGAQADKQAPKTGGLLLGNSFEPVDATPLDKELPKLEIMDMVVVDDAPAQAVEEKERKAEAEKNKPSAANADAPAWTFSSDAMWGNDRVWDRERKPENPLPQTAALLAPPERAAQEDRGLGGLPRYEPQRFQPRTPNEPIVPKGGAGLNVSGPSWENAGGSPAERGGRGAFSARPAGMKTPGPMFGQDAFKSFEPPKPIVTPSPVLPTPSTTPRGLGNGGKPLTSPWEK